MCKHQPRCPDALAPDCKAAREKVSHPEQGWSLLCNGVVLFEDAGALLPSGREVAPPIMASAVIRVAPAGTRAAPDAPSLTGRQRSRSAYAGHRLDAGHVSGQESKHYAR